MQISFGIYALIAIQISDFSHLLVEFMSVPSAPSGQMPMLLIPIVQFDVAQGVCFIVDGCVICLHVSTVQISCFFGYKLITFNYTPALRW